MKVLLSTFPRAGEWVEIGLTVEGIFFRLRKIYNLYNTRSNIMIKSMTEAKLDNLLSYSESCICDFKREIYHMDREDDKISFLKDILSMANTIRDDSAYIIIGVVQHDGRNEFQNVDASIDENQFLTFIKSTIGPEFPEFTYYTMKYRKWVLGIFEIGLGKNGPYFSTKDHKKKVIRGKIYYRYGSGNTEASEKMKAEITAWMQSISTDRHSVIFEQLEYFDTKKYNYVLFFGNEVKLSKREYEFLGKVKWAAIVDLSMGSEDNGFYKVVRPILEDKISTHLLTIEDSKYPEFYEGRTLLWFMAGGEKEQNGKILSKRELTSKYLKKVSAFLQKVQNSAKNGIIYVNIFSGDKSDFVESIVGMQEDNPLFEKYISIKQNTKFDIQEESGYVYIQGLLSDIIQVFRNIPEDLPVPGTQFRLPNKDGIYKDIKDISWIYEELEPLYQNIESQITESQHELRSFFEGRTISWEEMNPFIAVTRKKQSSLYEEVRSALKREDLRCKVIRLDYRAGAGATTILRKIGWDFHDELPVIFLKKYSSVGTMERLKSIYRDTDKNKMLIIIDEVSIDDQLVDELKNKILIEGMQIMILYSRRHLGGGAENYLHEQLNNWENNAFYYTYRKQVDTLQLIDKERTQREDALYALSIGDLAQRTPFMYALTAHEKEFVKLSEYVSSHLLEMSEEQENIFRIISVIQYFTGLDVPEILVKNEMSNITGRLNVKNRITELQRSLLIFESNSIRIIHHCVAEEILKYICGMRLINKDAWRNNLEEVLKYCINVLEGFGENRIIADIVKLLFLQQPDKEDNRGKHFSYAIEELPEHSAQKRILMKLKDAFPDNAYVYSNIARFYYYIEENEELALDEINHAIEIQNDYTFYHIKGLVIARKFGKFIEGNGDEIKEHYVDFVEEVKDCRDKVISAYNKSIELKYDNEYAYTGKINFCLNTIRKFHKHVCPDMEISDLFKSEKYYWCNQLLADIEDVLKDMNAINDYTDMQMDTSDYEEQVLVLQGNIDKAIQSWNNLLIKNDVYRPIIRRNLVNGYMISCNHDLNKLSSSKIEHLQKILHDNIMEERDNSKNILQWFEFSRYFEGNLSKAVEYFETETVNPTLQYYFYGMVVFMVYGLEMKDLSSLNAAEKCSKLCENLARNLPNRVGVKEFYNPSKRDICAIEKYQDIRGVQEKLDDVLDRIITVEGRIDSIDKPEVGWVRIEGSKCRIKFNPNWNPSRIYRKGKDENTPVCFVLGFRYEGPYAYHVRDI